ncbi:MAG TPA: metallophosphoesterase [Solirubrobacterales bacterium]|nr:metallophosphoesterase [Solirubrobacterales bacterium]
MTSPPAPATPPPDVGNSRESAARAGWRADPGPPYEANWERLLEGRKRTRWVNFFWISPAPLLASINDRIAKGLDDLINDLRPRWIAEQRAAGRLTGRPAVDAHAGSERVSFLVLGDPGEQDASQYAVVRPLLAVGDDTDFMLIASDVIYPAGDINDYVDGFFLPYERYRRPIYAIPGNHDWYDGLNGFMFHFCGAEALPSSAYRSGSYSWKERLARALWRKPSPPDLPVLMYERRARAQLEQAGADAAWEPAQPAPYFTIETPSLLIVCIDTGITGKLDREQGDWLRDVSRDPRPKLLVTGKPIYVDGEYRPGEIDWGPDDHPGLRDEVGTLRTVDDIVRAPEHRYVATIGGDVHNYQRYSVLVSDAGPRSPEFPEGPPPGDGPPPDSVRRLEYVVSGGGGAYLSATHRFGRVELDPAGLPKRPGASRMPSNVAPVDESGFWCYPLRGDSLARFVRRFAPGFGVALAFALGIVLTLVFGVFFGLLDGFDARLAQLDDARLSNVLWVLPLTLGLAAGVLVAAVKASNLLAPSGFRTLTATTLAAGGLVLVAAAGNLLGDAWDEWIWRLALTSLMAVVLPVVGVVGYYLVRDFLPQSVRTGIGLAIGIAVAAALVGRSVELEAEVPLLVGLGLVALWASVVVLGRLHGVPIVRFVPVTVGAIGAVVALVALQDVGWVTTGLLAGFVCAVLLTAVALLVSGWRAVPALPWLLRADVDPDMTANWLAGELGMEPVDASARTAAPDRKTQALSKLTYRSWPYRKFMSELAEATSPPFFKSFLRLDVTPTALVITAYGVTGWAEDETEPTVEDRVTIPLS